MLIAMRGLGSDTMAADATQSLALIRARQPGQAKRFVARLDVNESFACKVELGEPAVIECPALRIATSTLTEVCYGTKYDVKNVYWVDFNGKILQSRQFTGKRTGFMDFREVDSAGTETIPPRDAATAQISQS